MAYVLENQQESARLEKQATFNAYRLEHELRFLPIRHGDRILDAGCGTGLVARYLSNHFSGVSIDACDMSTERIASARLLSENALEKAISYFETPLEKIAAKDSSYDLITCRYVIEHLSNPMSVIHEFYRILKPGARVYLINFDGLFYNLYPMSEELQGYSKQLQEKAPFDLFAGRKIPNMLHSAGFKEVSWEIDVHSFKGKELEVELELNAERISFAIPLISQILGSEAAAYRFQKLFLSEMMKPGASLFYNKFLVTGVR